MNFFGYNFPGGKAKRVLVNGLVEISWYLPGDGLYSTPIAFTNLRGSASEPFAQKQINFLCDIATVHVVMLSGDTFHEDATRRDTIELLKRLSQAPGGLLILQTKEDKIYRDKIKTWFNDEKKIVLLKYEDNATVFVKKVQKRLKNKLDACTLTTDSLVEVAQKHKISVDEDDTDCIKGMKLMQELCTVIKDYRKEHPAKSCKSLLPLQSKDLWCQWAALDKEQYRQRKKHHYVLHKEDDDGKALDESQQYNPLMSVMNYSEQQRKKMKIIRHRQYEEAKKRTNLMPLFLEAMRTKNKRVLWYYMTWLKFELDDLSREILPPFHAKIRKKRTELNEIQKNHDEDAEKKCQWELKDLDCQLINASFGLEHLLREVGQTYEAVIAHEDINNPECMVKDLPQIAAQLLFDGFPIELLDGDVSHMPQQWVTAVLKNLAEILKQRNGNEPCLYVVSVLGIQSTGKSTLLNTVFGVQFSVSAGRCTRGAFMQLIPVHPSLYEKIRVQYFLLIDTEGLRAPELDRLEAREHDNELATFVIGLANLTLINVAGEVAGEIDDVLNAAVHAFMRMSEVNIKPSGHIIHQHVVAVGAEEKLMQARLKTKDKLDKMTRAAAKDTGLESKYAYFSDVIQFDHEKDVSEFVDLWNGEPPMAQVRSGYSKRAQNLKLKVIKKSSSDNNQNNTVEILGQHLSKLWKAILQEDFVFTFQNTYEIVAFKALEVKYSDIACTFMRDMNDLQQAAENSLFGCLPNELESTNEHHRVILRKEALNKYKGYEIMLSEFIEKDEIMLKWKHDMNFRLHEKVRDEAEAHCTQAYRARKDRAEAESAKQKLSTEILVMVQELVQTLEDKKLSEEKLSAIFNDKWSEWMKYFNINPLRTPNIEGEVENCLGTFFYAKSQWKLVHVRLGNPEHGNSLRQWGKCLEMEIRDEHINIKKFLKYAKSAIRNFITNVPKCHEYLIPARAHTSKIYHDVENYLRQLKHSGRNYCAQFITDLLEIVHNGRKIDSQEFEFTNEYEVDMAIVVCGYAIPVFEEMAINFRRKHDPAHYVEFEMKPHFRMMFANMYVKAGYEKIAAETLCRELKEPIKEFVLQSLSAHILKEMRDNPWTKDKQSFIAKVLLEIGQKLTQEPELGFNLCMTFLTNARGSLQHWAKYFTEQHCHFGCPPRISQLAVSELKDIIDFLIQSAKSISQSYFSLQKENDNQLKVNIGEWLKKFHSAVAVKIKLSLTQLKTYINDEDLSHLQFFTNQVRDRLEKLHKELCQELKNIRYSQTERRESAHNKLFEDVAGCTEQCPFCGAQCELTIYGHAYSTGLEKIKHTTHHRPESLGNYRWDGTGKAVLDICTFSVASDCRFRNKDTEGEYHPYKDYSQKYPDWAIPADKSFEASLYWKWFMGNFSTEIEKHFNYAKTDIPEEWKEIKWREVEEWLRTEYNL